MTAQRCVADGLFEWPSDEPKVRASRCDTCAFVTFPAQDACPSCGGEAVTPTQLSRTGTLWTWTRQRFQPKNPPYVGPRAGGGVRAVRRRLHRVARGPDRGTPGGRRRPGADDRHADGADGRAVHDRRGRHRGADVRVPSGRRRAEHMDDVAIIGVGLHPFGRFKGVSALEMGAKATRLALARRRHHMEGRAVRVRRQLRGGQPRRRGELPRARPGCRSRTSTTAAPPQPAR